jgi:hypothetical protein
VTRPRRDEIYEASVSFGCGVAFMLAAAIACLVLLHAPYGVLALALWAAFLAVACQLAFAAGLAAQDRLLGRVGVPGRRRCILLGVAHVGICVVAALVTLASGRDPRPPFLIVAVLGPLPLAVFACWGYSPFRKPR